jgi:hypothetical protein
VKYADRIYPGIHRDDDAEWWCGTLAVIMIVLLFCAIVLRDQRPVNPAQSDEPPAASWINAASLD